MLQKRINKTDRLKLQLLLKGNKYHTTYNNIVNDTITVGDRYRSINKVMHYIFKLPKNNKYPEWVQVSKKEFYSPELDK